MGLATFNVFIALTLSVTVLNNRDNGGVDKLTEANVTAFVDDIAKAAAGLRTDMTQHTLVEYLMAHLTENSRYATSITYRVGNTGPQERDMEMGRMEFINFVLQGLKSMEKHETKTKIDYIKVEDSGKAAHVVVTNYERGMMPMDDGFGDVQKVPILGTSYCEQKVVLSSAGIIQLDGAECTTTINFEDAF